MPTKTTTTKKAPVKKTAPKKTTTTKKPSTSTKKPSTTSKTPTVIVKENSIKKTDHSLCSMVKDNTIAVVTAAILVINTILLILVTAQTSSFYKTMEKYEMEKVGGAENYEIVKEIYGLDIYSSDQKRRLETVLSELKKLEASGESLPVTEEDLSILQN